MEAKAVAEQAVPLIVVVNFALVAAGLVAGGKLLVRGPLTEGVPEGRQNLAEFILDFFVRKSREVGGTNVVRTVAPFLATCFLLILTCNLVGMIPIPKLNYPPTAFFGVTLALAICAVAGTLIISGVFNGFGGAVRHLFWPNPLQFISEFTDVLSLSLRLFGNIGGEYMTLVLVSGAVAVGIPLILHVLGLIPAFVQALVFTLLTTSFIATVIHHEEEHAEAPAAAREHAETTAVAHEEAEEGTPDVEGESVPETPAPAM